MKKFIFFVVLFLIAFAFMQLSAFSRVQDIYGRFSYTKKIRILKVTEPPHYYELDNKKYTLKSLEEYVKQLQESESNKITVTWIIEIERPESYDSIQELIKVLKIFSYSYISISPAGYKE